MRWDFTLVPRDFARERQERMWADYRDARSEREWAVLLAKHPWLKIQIAGRRRVEWVAAAAARLTERAHREGYGDGLPGDDRGLHCPVRLQSVGLARSRSAPSPDSRTSA
jgi:hypothetical protein